MVRKNQNTMTVPLKAVKSGLRILKAQLNFFKIVVFIPS